MIGMALFTILMCVNFVACGGSDEDEPEVDNESGVVINEKKLVEMKNVVDGEDIIDTFTYDEKNRLISVKKTVIYNGESSSGTINYTWGNGIIKNSKSMSFNLVDNLIKSTDLNNATFTYNSSKQLISFKDEYNNDTYIQTYSWEGNKMSEITYNNGAKTTISYSNKTCKGYCPYMIYFIDDLTDLFFAHPELVGMRTNQLPNKIQSNNGEYEEVTELSYTFTNDGYIESCTEKYTTNSHGEKYSVTTIHTYKWQ